MKKIAILGLLFFMGTLTMVSQEHISLYGNIDKYINSDNFPANDTNLIYFNSNKLYFVDKKNYIDVFYNNELLDSISTTSIRLLYNFLDTSVFIITGSYKNYPLINIHSFSFNSKKYEILKKNFWGHVYCVNNGKLILTNKIAHKDTIIDELFYLDIHSKKLKSFFKLDKKISKYNGDFYDIYYQISNVFSFPYSNNLIIQIAEVYNAEADDQGVYFNYVYNFKDKTFNKIKNLDNIYLDHQIFDNNLKHSITGVNIYNKNYEFINKGVKPAAYCNSFQIFHNKLLTYYKTEYFKGKYVLVPVRFVYNLSVNMYKIFEGKLLNDQDLQNMEQVDLKILSSYLYAIYGYKFKSVFLNLYFEDILKKIYFNKSSNKLDVEKKFTSVDKQNLAIIDKYIVKPDLSKYSAEQITQAKAIISSIDTLSIYIYSNQKSKFDKYYNNFKTLISGELKKSASDKNLLIQSYLQRGLNMLSTDVSTPYETVHYQSRNVVNSLSALYGYKFSNQQWTQIFSLFDWYQPSTKVPNFEASTKNLVENLVKLEREFKN